MEQKERDFLMIKSVNSPQHQKINTLVEVRIYYYHQRVEEEEKSVCVWCNGKKRKKNRQNDRNKSECAKAHAHLTNV